MTIIIGADHGGFHLKNDLIEYLQEKNIRVEDMGAYEEIHDDDYPDYGKKSQLQFFQIFRNVSEL